MKALFRNLILVALVAPAMAFADVKSDMANPKMSLVAVMNNAMSQGMSASAAVSEMIKADRSMTNSIVATGLLVAPNDYSAIIRAAINAGAAPEDVVAAALIATDGENAEAIIASAKAAAPASKAQAIANAAARALAQPGLQPGGTVSPIAATTGQASGGGSSVTANDVAGLNASLASIRASLAAVGFSDVEVTAAISNLTSALTTSQQAVNAARAELASLASDLVAAQEAAAQAEALQEQVIELTAAAAAQEALAQRDLDEAAEAEAAARAAELEAAEAAAAAQAAAELAAQIEADAAEAEAVASDPDALAALAVTKRTETQAQLDAIGETKESATAKLTTARETANAANKAAAVTALDLQKVQSAISAAEGSGVFNETLTGEVKIAGLNLSALIALRDSLNAQLTTEQQTAAAATAEATGLARTVQLVDALVAKVAAWDEVNTNRNTTAIQTAKSNQTANAQAASTISATAQQKAQETRTVATLATTKSTATLQSFVQSQNQALSAAQQAAAVAQAQADELAKINEELKNAVDDLNEGNVVSVAGLGG